MNPEHQRVAFVSKTSPEFFNRYRRSSLNCVPFSSWQAEMRQRSVERSISGVHQGRGSQEQHTSFLQTCSCCSHTRETDSLLSNWSSSITFQSESQEKASAIWKQRRSTSEPSSETFTDSHCRGHWLVEPILMSVPCDIPRVRCKETENNDFRNTEVHCGGFCCELSILHYRIKSFLNAQLILFGRTCVMDEYVAEKMVDWEWH